MKNFLDRITRAVDRIISGSLLKQFLFFFFIALAAFLLLFLVRELFFEQNDPDPSGKFWNSVFNFINTGGFDDFQGAERWLVLLTNLGGMVIFSGILVAILTNFISQRVDNVRNGNVFYSFNDHIVIIGYDAICDNLVAQLAENNELLLQTTDDVITVRRGLFYNLNDSLKKKVYIVNGSSVLQDDIEKLNIDKCRQLFLFGDMDEDSHDSHNIDCLKIIINILNRAGRKDLKCHVLFKHHSTFSAFERHEIYGMRGFIDFTPFNFYDMWAQKIFVKQAYNSGEINYKPLDHEPITADSPMNVHLIVMGMSGMGIALGLQAAQVCHFPNFITKGIKTKITFIDEDAEVKMKILKTRLPSFFDEVNYSFCDYKEKIEYDNKKIKEKFTGIDLEFIKARFEDDETRHYLEQASGNNLFYLTIAVALRDPCASLSAALYLPSAVFDSQAGVLVRQEESHAIVSLLTEKKSDDIYRKYKNLRPFGMVDKCFEISEADDLLPMMVKYAYDKTKFDEELTITVFDEKQIRENWKNNWKESDNMPALKASNRYAANYIPVKQRSLNIKAGVELNANQINLAARMEHNRWVIEKLLVGFRAPSPEEKIQIGSDRKKREYYKAKFIHEDIKAYQELGEDTENIDVKIYDINISRALPYMLKALKN